LASGEERKITKAGAMIQLMERKIPSSGDKIVQLRKKYKLTQKELAGDEVDRTLVSYVENGKINLSEKTAIAIVKNVNRVFEARNIDNKLTIADIYVDMEEQVQLVLEGYIKDLEELVRIKGSIDNGLIIKIEEFMSNKEISWDKAYIYELMGDVLSNKAKDRFNGSYIFYSKAFDFYTLINEELRVRKLTVKIAKNRISIGEYEDAIKYITLLLCTTDESEDAYQHHIYYYWAKANMGLKHYDLAMNLSTVALKLISADKPQDKAKVLTLLGNCCVAQKNYDKANSYYKVGLQIYENEEAFSKYCFIIKKMITLTLSNKLLSDVTKSYTLDRLANDMLRGLKFVDEGYSRKFSYYINLVKVYKCLGQKKEIEKYMKLAVKSIFKTGQIHEIVELILEEHEFLKEAGFADELFEEQYLEKLCLWKQNDSRFKEAMFFLVSLLIEREDYDKALYVITNILENSSYLELVGMEIE